MNVDSYDVAAINQALDDLGMLSTGVCNRKEYTKRDVLSSDTQDKLTMNQQAGSSGVKDNERKINFFSAFKKKTETSNSNDNLKFTVMDCKEKENNLFGGCHILRYDSQFITDFKLSYDLPITFHGLRENCSKLVFRRNYLRKRNIRSLSHPYSKKSLSIPTYEVVHNDENPCANDDDSCFRLRTLSLSSGTSNRNKVTLDRRKSIDKNSGLQRSRSMEDLTGNPENSDKAKDLDCVSKGIQELHMEDCT